MTSQVPYEPAPFSPVSERNNQPDPRTVRATDLTWYNTRGGNIVTTSFNKCNGKTTSSTMPWNRPPVPENQPFWTCPFPRFDLYGLAKDCPCELNRCKCSPCKDTGRCKLYGGTYVRP